MNNKGYTLPELIILAVVLGIISFVTINKASYAFEETEAKTTKTEEKVIIKSATLYGESIKDTLKKEKSKYILATDLIEAGYLGDVEEYHSLKIKLEYEEKTDQIAVELIN